MSDIEAKAEKIWDLWREGKISHDEVQTRLDNELFPSAKGFFKALEHELLCMVNNNIFSKPDSIEAYFNKLEKVRHTLLISSNWVQFWQTCGFLENPKTEDIKSLKILTSDLLADYHVLICVSLKQFIESDLENSSEAHVLYQYYRLLKQEINSRADMPKLPERDAFLDYVKNKQGYKEQENLMEKARKTGSKCAFCGSTEVRSYGKAEWKCYNCGKRFRKH